MKRGKKLTDAILSIRDAKDGVEGIVGEVTPMTHLDGAPVNNRYGTQLHTIELADLKTGEVKKYWCDAGLRGTIKLARVTPGTPVAIVHTGEKEIEEGTVQTYDIFRMEN